MTDVEENSRRMAPRISIAMATYNGAHHLRAQLDSIRSQHLQPYELIVSDDRSTDGTIEIARRFAETAPFPVRIYQNDVNLGFGANFFRAAGECQGDWIAFSDQDDMWLPNKLSDSAEVIAKTDGLAMVLQKAKLCDEHLAWSGRMIPDSIRAGTYPPRSQYVFWIWFGFLQTIRRELFALKAGDLPMNYCRSNRPLTHDGWACVLANAIGKIVVVDRPAALYRRHDAAVTGYHQQLSLPDKLRLAGEVGAEHYHYLADAAASNAAYLERVRMRCAKFDWADRLAALARDFARMAGIQRHRAALYSASSRLRRLRDHAAIWQAGGYLGPAVVAMGMKSAAKDLAQVITGYWSQSE